jgi:hypothetical protein
MAVRRGQQYALASPVALRCTLVTDITFLTRLTEMDRSPPRLALLGIIDRDNIPYLKIAGCRLREAESVSAHAWSMSATVSLAITNLHAGT